MTHPRVLQLRFARSEFQRGLDAVSESDAQHRLMPMNCISSCAGHDDTDTANSLDGILGLVEQVKGEISNLDFL